jgi:hypothetical protein
MTEPEYQGDPRHPQHSDYLRQLGVAVFAAAGVTGIVVDILRIHHNGSYFALVDQTLGSLVNILRQHANLGSPVPDLRGYAAEVDRVRVIRNDLIHALPVLHGLHRRTAKDLGRVVNFYSVAALQAITADFDAVRGRGNRLLYYDGGEALRAWYQRGGS